MGATARTFLCPLAPFAAQVGLFSDMDDEHLVALSQLGPQLRSLELPMHRREYHTKFTSEGLLALGRLRGLHRLRSPGTLPLTRCQ